MLNTIYQDAGSDKYFYDPVQNGMKTIHYVKKFYGDDIYKQLIKETNEAHSLQTQTPDEAFSQDLKNRIRQKCIYYFPTCGFEEDRPLTDIALKSYQEHIGLSIKKEPKEEVVDPENKFQKKREKGDDFFWMLERGVVRNPEFRRMFKSNLSLYLWLQSNIVREGWIDKKGYPIKANYYDRGYLAYCSSYSKLAKDCFMDKDTVKKYIDQFAKDRIIKLEFIVPDGKKQKQGVYILGQWKEVNGQISERFYLDHAFLEARKDSPWYFKPENISPKTGE